MTKFTLSPKRTSQKSMGQAMRARFSSDAFQVPKAFPVRVDLDRLVTRHSAVLGSTGSGKSTTVASLLRSIAGQTAATASFPNARILLLDIHGEYANALKNIATVFRTNPIGGERQLFVPYWAI